MLASANTGPAGAMMFFRRPELTIRYAHRGLTLTVPDRDRLLDACEPGDRRRLQRLLGAGSAGDAPWEVQWQKMAGDALQPQDVVVALHRDGVVVELAFAQRGTLGEWQVTRSVLVETGTKLAVLERRAKTTAEPPPAASNDLLRQLVARQRRDAETIASLQAQLAALEARRPDNAPVVSDAKFRRLKHEFSKRFHPDARPIADPERAFRELIFREFWPILEEIERS
jgi:BMFP domain-containing protein YqiC